MNSELQVAGGGECRATTMNLRVTSEAVAMNLKVPSLRATWEGLSVNAEQAASQVTVVTAEGVEDPAQRLARQSRRIGAGEHRWVFGGGGVAPAVQWASTAIGRALLGAAQGSGGAGHGPAGVSPVSAG